MSNIDKQWLQQKIADMEAARDEIPFGLGEDGTNTLAALRIALASLEAEPVAVICFDKNYTRRDGSKPNWNEMPKVVSCNWLPDGDYPVYLTAPPAPVSVTETLPCPVLLEPGMRFGKGVRTQTMLDALQRRANYYAELEEMTPEQRAEHDAGMKEFAAMLQGAEPVSQRDSLNSQVIPDWQSEAEKMAELHGSSFVVFRSGETPRCADPSKVVITFTDEGLGYCSATPQQEA